MLALLAFTGSVCGGPVLVPLANPDFESPVLPANNNWSSPIAGWGNSGPPSPGVTFQVGSTPPASSGRQYAWCDLSDFDLTQYYNSIDGNARYELSVDLWPLDPANSSAQVKLGDLTAGRFMVEKSYRPAWDTNLLQFDLPSKQWTTVRVSFHGHDFPGITGHILVVNIHGAYLAVDNLRLYKTAIADAPAASYYISSSQGNDASNGLTPATAWRSFTNANDRHFAAGTTILLQRGDVWSEELNLRGNGAPGLTNCLGAYGSGVRPLILRSNKDHDRCIVLNNPSHWRIADLECRNACLGVFVRCFESLGNQNVTVENCRFVDFDSWLIDPRKHLMEWAVPAAIWVGGILRSTDTNATVFAGLTVRNCTMENVTAGIGSGFYYYYSIPARVTGFLVEDSFATRVTIGALSFDSTSNAVFRRFRSLGRCGKPGGLWTGSTGVMMSDCTGFLFEDCEFAETDRAWSDPTQGDGCGLDFERHNTAITLRRCLFHSNDGEGVLSLATTTGLANTNILIDACTFWSNALDPADATYSPGGNAYEIKFTENTFYGTVTNCGFYRGVTASNWYYPAAPPSVVKLRNNRTLWWTNVASRLTLPSWHWNTNGSFEGWTNRNQWGSPTVAAGVLTGTAQNNDPYAYSPPLWVNTHRNSRYVRVRLRTTGGTQGAIYFITETDPVWDGNKVVGFPLIADNQYHDYVADLRASAGYGGVVTQIRLDPTDVPGAQFAVDSLVWQPWVELGQLQLLALDQRGARLRFNTDPGISLRLQASTNLTHWMEVATGISDVTGMAEFADPAALPSAPHRFYRVAWP